MLDPYQSPRLRSRNRRKSTTRRRALWAIGITATIGGTAALLGEKRVEELIARSRNFRDRLIDQWYEPAQRSLADESEYRAFLEKLSLRYISPEEIIRPHRNVRRGIANELPPRHMWPRIAKTLKVADEIRHRLGSPLDVINSAYRCPEYNLACGGAKKSYHMQNRALDLMFREGSEAASKVALKMRDEGFFKGGIGLYPTFIHIDTRGFNASWGNLKA